MSIRLKRRHVAKAASYTVNPAVDAGGTVFTNDGAVGAIVFTLPTGNQQLLGDYYDFEGVADQTITVSAGAGLGISLNNAACASLAASTGGQKIGSTIRATCIKTSAGFRWRLAGIAVGVTYTVA